MPDIQIERHHQLGLPGARALARKWMRQVEADYGLAGHYTEGDPADTATFSSPGVDGSVEVTADRVRLSAALGFLLGGFAPQIEARLQQNLDALLGPDSRTPARA